MWIGCTADLEVLGWPSEPLEKRALPIRRIKPLYESDLRVRESWPGEMYIFIHKCIFIYIIAIYYHGKDTDHSVLQRNRPKRPC